MTSMPTTRPRLTGAMTPEERARVVVALDHDVRQPQHAIEMGLRNLRLLAGELEEITSGAGSCDELAKRMRTELASVQAAARQIVDTQQDLIDAIRLEFDDTRPTPRTIRADDLINRIVRMNRVLASSTTLHGAPSRLAFLGGRALGRADTEQPCLQRAMALWRREDPDRSASTRRRNPVRGSRQWPGNDSGQGRARVRTS